MDIKQFFIKNKIEYYENRSLKEMTTIKIGGKCKYCCFFKNEKQIIKIIKFCLKYGIMFYILGNGSNVLASDDFFDGVIIQTTKFCKIKKLGNMLSLQSGVNLFYANKFAQKKSLSGLEFSYGIPGTIGGATVQNAGAFQSEICDLILQVRYFDGKKICKKSVNELQYSYRNSIFCTMKNFCILTVKIKLKKGRKDCIGRTMRENFENRLSKQPYDKPSAGSVFKKIDDIIVSKAIDNMGLKGYSIFDAEISTKHAGFIVNNGNASYENVMQLIDYIQQKFWEKYHKRLSLEIRLLR